jgi:hypothetical protein
MAMRQPGHVQLVVVASITSVLPVSGQGDGRNGGLLRELRDSIGRLPRAALQPGGVAVTVYRLSGGDE